MKRIMTFTGWLVMAATFIAGITACTKENNTIDDPVPMETPTTYTLTVEATKGDSITRALTLEGKTLNATWTEGDVVSVQKESGGSALTLGSLKATNVRDGGLTCTLTGELTTLPNVNDELTLKYQFGAYGTQKGTLEGIATKHDAAIATIIVANMPVEERTITATGVANFVNQQAIVKFSLKRPDGTTPFAATSLNVKYGSNTYKVRPDAAMSELFVAIPGNSATISLEATDGTDTYFYNKDGVTFTNGQYYAIGVTMKRGNVDLAAATGDVTLKKGDIAYGTLAGDYKVSIISGAEVTLNGVNIAGTTGSYVEPSGWAGITCKGTATINIYGTNTVRAFYQYYPGILIPSGKTLTIQGDGALEVSSFSGAAIGGGCVLNPDPETPDTKINCGNIVIKGGTITAQGGDYSAGIGSGWTSSCGYITISGGTITATGGKYSAGIGTGTDGICGNISISGGIVTASGTHSSAGIGTGHKGSCGDITITDKVTSVTAYRRESTDFTIGKSKDNYTCGKVIIGGTTYYNGSSFKNDGETYLATNPFIYQP